MTNYQAMTCNAHVTSNPHKFARWVEDQVKEHDLDLIAFQELTIAHGKAVRDRLWVHYRLAQFNSWGDAETVAVLARRTLPVKRVRCVRVGRKGWFGWRTGRQHAPRSLTYVALEGGLAFASTHAPPGVDAGPDGLRGVLDRRLAWIAFVRAVRRWTKRHDRFVIAADWNDPHRNRGLFSIDWLCRKTGATPRGAGIDYVIRRGALVWDLRRIPGAPGTDHDALLFKVKDRA
jgi:hypothetical protein